MNVKNVMGFTAVEVRGDRDMDSLFMVLIGVFLIFCITVFTREVYCWYARVNMRVSLMEQQLTQSKETNRLLTKLLEESQKTKDEKGVI